MRGPSVQDVEHCCPFGPRSSLLVLLYYTQGVIIKRDPPLIAVTSGPTVTTHTGKRTRCGLFKYNIENHNHHLGRPISQIQQSWAPAAPAPT
jgi:hypothetical protein